MRFGDCTLTLVFASLFSMFVRGLCKNTGMKVMSAGYDRDKCTPHCMVDVELASCAEAKAVPHVLSRLAWILEELM